MLRDAKVVSSCATYCKGWSRKATNTSCAGPSEYNIEDVQSLDTTWQKLLLLKHLVILERLLRRGRRSRRRKNREGG